jgi:hypothetical protein
MRNLIAAVVITAAIFIILAIMPDTREVLHAYESTAGDGVNLKVVLPTARRKLAQHPDDWQLAMGVGKLQLLKTAEASPKEGLDNLQQAVKLSGEKPAALMALALAQTRNLGWSRIELLGFGKHSRTQINSFFIRMLEPQEAAPARETLLRLAAVDPGNGAPKALLANIAFGEHKDTEGLSWLKAAARAPRLDFYTADITQAQAQALEAGGLLAFRASWESYQGLRDDHYQEVLREMARVVLYKGREALAAGKSEEAAADLQSLARLGRLIWTQADTEMDATVGMAIEASAISPVYTWHRMNGLPPGMTPVSKLAGKQGRFNGGDIFRGEDYERFHRLVGDRAAAQFYTEREQVEQIKQAITDAWLQQNKQDHFYVASALVKAGIAILAAIGLLLVLIACFTLLTWWSKPSAANLRTIWVIVFALLVATPALLVWQYQTHPDLNVHNPFMTQGTGLDLLPAVLFVTISIFLLLLFWSVVAALGLWEFGHVRERFSRIWLATLGQIGIGVLVVLALVSLGVTYQAGRAMQASTKDTQVLITKGEMAKWREQYPELFRELKKTQVGDKGK